MGKNDFRLIYTMETPDGEREITKVESEKDLGVITDQNLTFREHIIKQNKPCQ